MPMPETPPPSDPPHRFVLGWGAHQGQLTLPRRPGRLARDGAAGDALALAPVLPTLQALEDWLGQALTRLEPAGVPAPDEALVLQLPLAEGGSAVLRLPPHGLPFGRPLPPALAAAWPPAPARLVVQTLPAAALEADRLRPGALLLLPASYEPDWAVCLAPEAAAWPALARGGWCPGGTGPAAARPVPRPGPQDWQVTLTTPLTPSAAAWFGAEGPLPGGTDGAELRRAGRCAARGRFVPAGAGWALQLDAR